MATEHQKSVTKWGLAALGNAASVGGFGLALDLEMVGGALVVTAELSAAAVICGTLAVSATPVILVGLIAAIATTDERASHDLAEGAEALEYISGPTLAAIGLSAPFMPWLPAGDPNNPFAGQKLVGSLVELGTSYADLIKATNAGKALETGVAGINVETAIPTVFTNIQKLQPYFSQPSSSGSASSSGASPGGPSAGGSASPGGGIPGGGDFYPFSPGMGEWGGSDTGGVESESSSQGDGFTLTFGMTPYGPGGVSVSPGSGGGIYGTGTEPGTTGTGTEPTGTGTGTEPTGTETGTEPTGTGTGTEPTGTETGTEPTGTGTGTEPTGTGTGTGTGTWDDTDPEDDLSSIHSPSPTTRVALRGAGRIGRDPSRS